MIKYENVKKILETANVSASINSYESLPTRATHLTMVSKKVDRKPSKKDKNPQQLTIEDMQEKLSAKRN